MNAPITVGVWVTMSVLVAYVLGGILVAVIGRTFGPRGATLCIVAVSILLLAAFVLLSVPIERVAIVSALQSAFMHALPFVLGWIVVGALVRKRVLR